MWCEIGVQICSLALCISTSSMIAYCKNCYFHNKWSCYSCQNSINHKHMGFIHGISILFHFIFMPVPHCFDTCSFVVKFDIRKCEYSNFVTSFKIGYTGSLEIYMSFRISLCIFAKKKKRLEFCLRFQIWRALSFSSLDRVPVISLNIFSK